MPEKSSTTDNPISKGFENTESLYYEILNVKPILYLWVLEQLFNYDRASQSKTLDLNENDEILIDPQVYPSKILADPEIAQKLQKAYPFCFYKKTPKIHINGDTVITKVLKSAYKTYVSRTHNKTFKEGDYVYLKVNGRQYKILKCYESKDHSKDQYLLEQTHKNDSRLHIIAQKQDIQHYNFK